MAIIVGDIHGNVEKVRAFLAYKQDELHIALGDYLDSFTEPPERQLEALRLLIDSDAVLLWGNHDLHYLKTPPWYCTGRQWDDSSIEYTNLLTTNKTRFQAAYAVDGWLCSHAGVRQSLLHNLRDAVAVADKLNAEFAAWANNPVCFQRPNGDLTAPTSSIFTIGRSRGGSGIGGIFWFDHKREYCPDDQIKQIFGHTESKEPVVTDSYICLDTTNNDQFCWLYDTSVNELVQLRIAPSMHEEIIDGMRYKVVGNRQPLDNNPRWILDLPEEEQGPFSKYLKGKTVPGEGRYWPADYRRWKPAYEEQKARMAEIWTLLSPEEQARCNDIKFAVVQPAIAGWTPTEDDKIYLHHLTHYPRLRYLPKEEQGPFRKWMLGQSIPFVPGLPHEDQDFFYQYDYDRWKRHPNSWVHP